MISIITPVHKASSIYIEDTYNSFKSTDIDWEWILVLNNGGTIPAKFAKNKRIKILQYDNNSIGSLKKFGFDQGSGDILVELDADDLLTPGALEKIQEVFEDPKIQFVYSNNADFVNGTWESRSFSEYWGWRKRDYIYQGHNLYEMLAWEPSAHMMRYIFWAPDHVRAWRSDAYKQLGGHNPDMPVGDDHDLCCRTYIAYGQNGMKHIDKCLYLYRLHEDNSFKLYNADIQKATEQNYIKYSRDMIVRWSDDNGLLKVDLGGRFNPWSGFTTVDLYNADLIFDLNSTWGLKDNSVGVLRASHIFEHLRDPIHSMNEAYRILAPGGWLLIEVPSTDGRGAFQDPTHVSFWNENSFWYYTQESHARFIRPLYTGRFQKSRIVTYYPTEFEQSNNIPIVQADLIALKPPYSNRPVGEVLI